MTGRRRQGAQPGHTAGRLFILITTGAAYTVGPLTNPLLLETKGTTAWAPCPNANSDLIMPTFINQAMPELFVVVFMLVLLSAAMSTLSAILHTMGTTAGYDLWRYVRKWREGTKTLSPPSLKANRVGTLFMLVLSFGFALSMTRASSCGATAMFMGCAARRFMPAFVHPRSASGCPPRPPRPRSSRGRCPGSPATAFVHVKESSVLG